MKRSLRAGLHRHVWPRLPPVLRRSVLFRSAHLLAPKITTSATLSAPVIVVGALRTASGLGESARLCHDAIRALGVPVFGIDIAAQLMQPVDDVAFDFTDGRHLMGPGTLIVHVNGPLMPLAMLALSRAFVRDKFVAGYWAWELPQAPATGSWDFITCTKFGCLANLQPMPSRPCQGASQSVSSPILSLCIVLTRSDDLCARQMRRLSC